VGLKSNELEFGKIYTEIYMSLLAKKKKKKKKKKKRTLPKRGTESNSIFLKTDLLGE
jgi:hypothetical protein